MRRATSATKGTKKNKAKFVNRKISARIENVCWHALKNSSGSSEDLKKIKKALSSRTATESALKTFNKLLALELSLSSITTKTAHSVFSKDWIKDQENPKPSTQIIEDLRIDGNTVYFSLSATWNNVPIKATIKSMDDFLSLIEWPSSLVDHLSPTKRGEKILGEIEESGIDAVTVDVQF